MLFKTIVTHYTSLPVGALEYTFKNVSDRPLEMVFSYHSRNFLAVTARQGQAILPIGGGFILRQDGSDRAPQEQGEFAIFTDAPSAVVDHGWFRGTHYDAFTLVWKNIQDGVALENPPMRGPSPGASLYVPFSLGPGQEKTIRLMLAWYVPRTDIRIGADAPNAPLYTGEACCSSPNHVPWYACHFKSIGEVADYWRNNYDRLRVQSALFRDTFYDSTLPAEVIEAIAANLTILKSPTVLRQSDGRLWCFEGCNDDSGCCYGTCTHVWNYAQAIPHLFADLERTLRETEFNVSQDARGHQLFRTNLPIRPGDHEAPGRLSYGAADGQLGGIMKVHREWRISGDTAWLKSLWPHVRRSLDFCIQAWDPRARGALEEPHHNTYDIEYWGPDGHCTSFYLGAFSAAIKMGTVLADDVARYRELLKKGKAYMETKLYNGEYFFQIVMTDGLSARFEPVDASANGPGYGRYVNQINQQGPKYQYGTGCLSDGVLGLWMAHMCGLDGNIVDGRKTRSHLKAIHQYNLKDDLSGHANPQRPSYAMGDEGGLLLCTWPRGNELAIPFIYSNEVWTGIEYQVASHLMLEGMVDKGLEIVRLCRNRYDGVRRNPFNEYECGHWYARALSSYGLLQGLTGVRHDAVDRTLYINSQVGNSFRTFLAWEKGFGTVGLRNGKPFVEIKSGALDVKRVVVSGKEMSLQTARSQYAERP